MLKYDTSASLLCFWINFCTFCLLIWRASFWSAIREDYKTYNINFSMTNDSRNFKFQHKIALGMCGIYFKIFNLGTWSLFFRPFCEISTSANDVTGKVTLYRWLHALYFAYQKSHDDEMEDKRAELYALFFGITNVFLVALISQLRQLKSNFRLQKWHKFLQHGYFKHYIFGIPTPRQRNIFLRCAEPAARHLFKT